MKLCAAQIKPINGDIEANIEKHKKLIDLAIANGADIIIFPELSITGYEPAVATGLIFFKPLVIQRTLQLVWVCRQGQTQVLVSR